MGIKSNEVDRCIDALEDQVQSSGLTFEYAPHSECCSVRCPQRTSSEITLRPRKIRWRQRTLQLTEVKNSSGAVHSSHRRSHQGNPREQLHRRQVLACSYGSPSSRIVLASRFVREISMMARCRRSSKPNAVFSVSPGSESVSSPA